MVILILDPWGMALPSPQQVGHFTRKQYGEHYLTNDHREYANAGAVVFHVPTLPPFPERRPKLQKWVGWSMESEVIYPLMTNASLRNKFDLLITYHLKSDIPVPYFDRTYAQILFKPAQKKVQGKLCSCFISNTTPAYNKSKRMEYMEELKKYIPIDFYGKFLRNQFLDQDAGVQTKMDLIGQYKFNLAFENSVAEDYVTEKFFQPLEAGTVPVYFGAPNITKFMPGDNSFIDVRKYASPKELADHLLYLDQNETEYEKYLEWKQKPVISSFQSLLDSLPKKHVWENLFDILSNNKNQRS